MKYTPDIIADADTTMRVFILCSGISDYRGSEIDLRFAAKDAEKMSGALQVAAGQLFVLYLIEFSNLNKCRSIKLYAILHLFF